MDTIQTDLVVLGAGPGGYAAAFYAADLGKRVVLVERDKRLGGVCLNTGCIPSKALLHATHAVSAAHESAARGITFGPPQIEVAKLRAWKDGILNKLGAGVAQLAQRRGVQVLNGTGRFTGSNSLVVKTEQGEQTVNFQNAIIATGSRPALPRTLDIGSPRVMTSTEALDLADIPANLLIVGGGYIGMELGTVYAALGSKVTVAEAMDNILLGADADLVRPVLAWARKHFREVRLKAKVTQLTDLGEQVRVAMEFDGKTVEEVYDRVLVAVGRVANSAGLGLENTKAALDAKGFLVVNEQQQTGDPAIYAIGDVAGGALLAHKAAREARVAVAAIAGKTGEVKKGVIPAVVFTDPEVAWCGLTESDAQSRGIAVQVAKFPWGASGRALSMDRTDGLTKLIIEPQTERVLGVGIVGHGAGELIAEGVVAVENGSTVKELADCIHPHPTLSETFMEAAELFYGHSTHTFVRKK
ncbi:MAG: dihydrolipoyl dehydrogenase [Verrucomicrobia bacterium]|nr:dihydrolipoyl dehydrogenase [Verrucomicrobiota bacterium]